MSGEWTLREASRAILRATAAWPGEGDWPDVVQRVATAVAQAEPAARRAEWGERFASWMLEGCFFPSIPILANAGRGGPLEACFVLEPEDSLDSIYDSLRRAALIQQGSGGAGIHFSKLRARGTPIERSGGRSPGPCAFVELYAQSARTNALAGRRAGAHLAVLRDDHPDVLDFVGLRRERGDALRGIGLALGVNDALLDAARQDREHALRDASGRACGALSAGRLLREIALSIHEHGDPTLLFLDRIAADNSLPELGRIEATNPCGEQPLLPDESCVLGSLALPAFADARGRLDAARLRAAVGDAIRFLDDVIEVSVFPDARLARAARHTRKLGLGLMGFAGLLLRRGEVYGSAESLATGDELMCLVAQASDAATRALAGERGGHPACRSDPARRNATCLAIAPTGTIRLLAGCSGGLEPLLAPVVRVRAEGGELRWSDVEVERFLAERGAREPALAALAAGVPAAELPGLDADARALLRRGHEVDAEAQLALQGVFQRHVDGAISKTLHLPSGTGLERIEALVFRAREQGCKGAAFFVGGSLAAPEIELGALSCTECEIGHAPR
ncbi:MAG TPA: ribonucleotide reductase N-terminal alpha domain-containing protein [Myxococcota bacterium]|nr:ribonucleotide reductase N-terminal alpha domain-containing protein [Myxococcota bacterium]